MSLRCKALIAACAGALAVAGSAGASNYVVLYKAQAVPANAAATIAQAGGTLVYAYDQIGVAIASSDNAAFRDNLLTDARVENAASTAGFATRLAPDQVAADDGSNANPGDLPNAPASDTDSLSPLQWDTRQLRTPAAHAITGGSPAVLVGDIDTGTDFNHPDL